ncbi:hypothetical protein WICMUC_000534 [Wickerhamomyces mucosus]|uniref:Uncharacterized protein n=1 Tax=Wickerhamomyces mucosus TaxID=1378264 RepID=A0A9P8THU3_9ASCO|nr:hypothetical protein WICMUC_000534 [Wickerhamomyces mucosus]
MSYWSNDNTPHKSSTKAIKLISVRLKEAALDSPSFRASVNNSITQIEQTELWIEGLLKSLKKYPQQFQDFEQVNNVMFNQLLPEFLQNGLINKENTSNVIETSKTNLNSLWSESLKNLNVNAPEIIDLLGDLSRTHLRAFKETRKNFEFLQSKYDSLLLKFLSQSKSKEPSALREDSFQLFEARKLYLSSVLDMPIELSRLYQLINVTLMELSYVLLADKDTYDRIYFDKVKSWNDAQSKSADSLLQDMISSKAQIEKATIKQFEPSRDLKHYSIPSLDTEALYKYNPDVDGPQSDLVYEKHGWLSMKTTVGKPARTIWVRRWAFVKSGVFGLFNLSPSKTFVQESDKIGVLLINVKYASDEDRRFCFEVKSSDTTIVFQAESLKEFRSWLRVFKAEKQRVLDSPKLSGQLAFGRYPPVLTDFASTSLTTVDAELTSSRYANNDAPHPLASESVQLAVLTSDNFDFQDENNYYKNTDFHTPVQTSKSKAAIAAKAYVLPSCVPSAITANTWGSVHWGLYYMTDNVKAFNGSHYTTQTPTNNVMLSSLIRSHSYPTYYPNSLKSYDVQMRALFDFTMESDELLLGYFNCLWSLKAEQELSGCCFLTHKNAYFYLNSTGFILLRKKPLTDIVAVDVQRDTNWDVLKIYDFEGLNLRGRIFLEDAKIIQKEIDILINNSSSENPKGNKELLEIFQTFGSSEKSSKGPNSQNTEVLKETISFQPFTGSLIENTEIKTDYTKDHTLLAVESFNAPAKALFHILYGDHSSIARESAPFFQYHDFHFTPWFNDNGKRTRMYDYKLSYFKEFLNLNQDYLVRIRQVIEEFVDNKYYRIEERKAPMKVFLSDYIQITRKIIIIETDTKSCKVLFYQKFNYPWGNTSAVTNILLKATSFHIGKSEVLNIAHAIHKAVEKLGAHGKILKSIRTYGNLSKTNEAPKIENIENFLNNISLASTLKYYTKSIIYLIVRTLFSFMRLFYFATTTSIQTFSTHKFLIGLLGLSIFFNIFLIGKSTVSFWYDRRTNKIIDKFKDTLDVTKMKRSISLDELDVLSKFGFNNSSVCFDTFISHEDPFQSNADIRFRETRHQIAVKRNELLVELKILEKTEMELISGSFKNFLLSEINLCKISLNELNVEDRKLIEYCSSCITDYRELI